MSAVTTSVRSAEPSAGRYVTPVLVLLVGLAGVVIGLVADRGFDAGLGTGMVLLGLWMLADERRARADRKGEWP